MHSPSATRRRCRRTATSISAVPIRCAVSANPRSGREIRWAIPTAATSRSAGSSKRSCPSRRSSSRARASARSSTSGRPSTWAAPSSPTRSVSRPTTRSTRASCAPRPDLPCSGSLRSDCSDSATRSPCDIEKRRSSSMAISSRASSSPSAGRSEPVKKRRSNLDVLIACVLLVSCLALAVFLASCKNVLNDEDESFHLRVVNLLEDSPAVLYYVDSTSITSANYQGATALGAARPGNHTVSLKAVRPASLNSDDTKDPIDLPGSFSQDYGRDRDYTVFAYGRLNDVHTFVVDEPSDKDDVEDDFIEWQMVNAAPNLPAVDVYLTAPEANINSAEKVATISFGAQTTASKLKLFRRSDVTDEKAALIVDMTFELRDPTTGARLFNSGKIRLSEQTRLLFAIAH